MLARRAYYIAKPYLPDPIRLQLRRMHAWHQLRRSRTVWPVDPVSAAKPPNWSGWPEGKRFAFVLTHDVEGPAGLEQCRALMALESKHGFRSSFNFVPEGTYHLPPELRRDLVEQGYEVGVHDLRHDGSLYASYEKFLRHAAIINRYLKDWNAVGFRSGFMLHNLEWLKNLDVLYDASTFDTDPFEPQPDGARTIFPFLVPRGPGRSPYVELPYTIPQDSTAFLIFRDGGPELLRKKLDWVAEQGGMALINVHPDYIDFDHGPTAAAPGRYSFRHYAELLEYVQSRYGDACWKALPREVARFIREAPTPTTAP